MAVFRVEKTKNYTVMANHHLQNKALTLKAKGLLSMMLSLPEKWDYSTRGLAAICKEGVDSIGAALKELEHTMNSPGVRDYDSGPYEIVDLSGYAQTPGYSGFIFSDRTMHAIGWVLRHTYPFAVLDRGDADNEVWSRVAGQFAIREVVKQLEGAQYVRDYWQMDNFYRASGQAPGEYLEYARWLAAQGIAHGRITGEITVSNKSVSAANGICTGVVQLTTDADRIRISRSAGTITGHTGGEDGNYYYLHSGDTISVSSPGSGFSFVAESISSADEEANFLIGVPDADIQKILIPARGEPYPMKSVKVEFEIPYGALHVTKTDAATGALLSGAVFELLNSSGAIVDSQATGADGIARFANLQPGSYIVREKSAPDGYLVAVPNAQSVTITAGGTANASFANTRITSKIRILKKDQLTKEPLSGAEFTITRVSAPAALGGAGVGSTTVMTTDANGVAESGWLEWGRYRIEETKVPEHFVDNHFSVEIDAFENGKTYEIQVENEPTKGIIQLVKTDRLDGTPIAGVTFDIYYNDALGNDLAGTMTTDENGVAVSPPLRKGTYLVKERDHPTGYTDELIVLDATVKPDETTYLSGTNQPIQGKIRIVKIDQLTREALAGAEFTITRVSGLPSHKGSGDGEVVARITTDAEGIAISPLLTYGTYRIEETKVPEHYVDNAFSVEVTVDEDMKTTVIEAENEPTKGWIRLIKTDRKNSNPIEGVQFDIYENDAYGNALVGAMTTDENGVAVSPPLRKGKYIVREQGETAGYVFEEIVLDATVKSDETTELTATNQPVQVKLRLYKRDKEEYGGGTPNVSIRAKSSKKLPKALDFGAPVTRGDGELVGAVFQVLAGADITDRQENVLFAKGEVVVESLTTSGDDACVTTDELWPGLYEIVELSPPVGYQPNDKPVYVDTGSAAYQYQEAVITYDGLVTNKIRYGAQAIVKALGDDEQDPNHIEQPETGAEFNVYLKCAGSYENARAFERDHLTTDKHGYAKTKPLPYGIYVLEQTKGKDGYEIKGPIDFEIDGTEDLINPSPIMLSDRPILYRLRMIKTDAQTGKVITLANTSFKLKNAQGEYVTQKVYYPAEGEIDTFTTDETGTVTLPETVTWGLYYVEEVQAPEGYLLRDEAFAVFVGRDGDKPGETYTLEIEIPNQPVKGHIILEKRGLQLARFEMAMDAYGNEVHSPVYEEGFLAGVVFEVRAANTIIGSDGTIGYLAGELVDTFTTSGEGADKSKELPLGKYILTETYTPEGYALDSTPHEVELCFVDDQTASVEAVVKAGNDYLPAEITLRKEKESTQVETHADGSVRQSIINTPGEGFVFGLFNDTDIHYDGGTLMADTLVATGTTGADGSLTFPGYFPHGDYYIRELYAPAGWRLNPERFSITLDPTAISDNPAVIRVSLPDAVHDELIYTKITITKTDITGERTLPGATMEVINSAGEVIYRAVTDKNGCIPDIPVTPGKYTFREVLAPDGYALNEATMRFEVAEDGAF